MSLVLLGSTSGSVTLQEPAVAGTTTLTLPAVSGTILQSGTTVTEAQGGTGTTTGYYGFKNRIINGAMVIAQRGTSAFTQSTSNQFGLDRFDCTGTVSSKVSFVQSSVAPSGFINSTLITSLSAYSVLTGDFFVYRQRIEGLNCADLGWGAAGAATVTVSFWVRSSLTGSFGGYLANASLNRSYPFSYTINAANTWEQKTVTIAGDTTGTWLTTNGSGIEVGFSLGAGSTYSGTANTWAGSYYVQPTSSTNLVGTNGATFYITGVQLEKGSTATSFDYRPYGTELMLCQRYYFKMQGVGTSGYFGTGFNDTTTTALVVTQYTVPMRAAPTALEQSGTAADYFVNRAGANTTCSAVPVFSGATSFSTRTEFIVASGLTAGQGMFGRSSGSNSYLAWSAEL